ncbi:ribosome maturation factor RimM [Buchnera aphidicola]|uniref:Ribosome maturation factor RimM n=1 Tax=Buchnera aphidicola subsp. Tuberolachnus salignus TaxID=98804 RepID=A0A160SWY1_BUCTT|nr:ribosome maturation factor RimM [Buchnera aphidicola]CUR53240.1 Ribosome maturation factor RimM [Buchnera aphidicola (Tuberolachnus salignus)]
MNNTIIIGKFGKPYGIKGWIQIISYTTIPKKIFYYFPWYLKNFSIKYVKKDIKNWKQYKKYFIIKIKNINDRTHIEFLKNQKIFIKKKILPILKNHEFYWNDLLQCTVYNTFNIKIGIVKKILDNSVHEILVIKKNSKKKFNNIIFLPLIFPNYILSINIIKKKIIANMTNHI